MDKRTKKAYKKLEKELDSRPEKIVVAGEPRIGRVESDQMVRVGIQFEVTWEQADEFADRMRSIFHHNEDHPIAHRMADKWMCTILRLHGYSEGVEIFENAEKGYYKGHLERNIGSDGFCKLRPTSI